MSRTRFRMNPHSIVAWMSRNSLLKAGPKYEVQEQFESSYGSSRLEFIHFILSITTKFLFRINAMYFSNPFGVTSIFTSNLLSSQKIEWLSLPLKLWNITGTFLVNWRFCVTTPVSFASRFSSYVTMIFYFFIVIINEFFTNPASVSWLKLFFFFFSLDQTFGKVFFHYFFTEFILLKDCFNKFVSSIFTSKNNNRFTKFIINTNRFVSKTTRNVILIFFEYEPS